MAMCYSTNQGTFSIHEIRNELVIISHQQLKNERYTILCLGKI